MHTLTIYTKRVASSNRYCIATAVILSYLNCLSVPGKRLMLDKLKVSNAIPAHVPRNVVVDFDFYHPEGGERDFQQAWLKLREGAPIKWTPRNGGHWIATRAEDIKEMQLNYEVFSYQSVTIPRSSTPSLPTELDPPEHGPMRALISPLFAPDVLKDIEPRVRVLSRSLIQGFKPNGKCEFQSEFARHLPIAIFLHLMDLPLEAREMLLDYAEKRVRSSDPAVRDAAKARAVAFLNEKVAERRVKPGKDFITRIMNGKIGDRPPTPFELENLLANILSGGMDTVASLLGFIIRYLAVNPQKYARLAAEPSIIPKATDELIRRHGIVNTARMITRDIDYKGMPFKKGERIVVPNHLYGLDEAVFEQPMDVDFDRPNATAHAAFGNGPHRCPGANLGRLEVRIVLEEWSREIPSFGLDPQLPVVMHPGLINTIASLPLVWPVAGA